MLSRLASLSAIFAVFTFVALAGEKLPHGQKTMPGPSLPPDEALAKIMKDGLNIPCGVVMGSGGFYYTNPPDIVCAHLDANGKIDREEVILTGFGRSDRHELPNSLTWGPDGWLYGMNGVFNPTSLV